MVTLRGGWYRLFVRAMNGSSLVTESVIDRVGVGEVFIIAGQSNASGGHAGNPGAADDRVSVIDWFQDDLPEAGLPLVFSQASENRRMAPFNPLHMWGMLGDRLVSRLNVPVLFYGGAYGGSNSEVWRLAAQGKDPGGTPGPFLMPYRPLGAAIDHYAKRTGVRAVLWHQGESDNGWRGQQAYFDNVKSIIDKTRQQSGMARLPWVVSRVSYIGGTTDPNIIAAQNQLIQTLDQVFPGPETDAYTGPDDRFDGLHFGGNGLNTLTNLWNNSLSNDFFNRSAPGVLTNLPPAITTGSIVPIGIRAGQNISVPSVRQSGFSADNQFVVRLFTESGAQVGQLATGTQNPIIANLPSDLPTGQYVIRVDGTNPAVTGNPSQSFGVTGQTPVVNTPIPTSPGTVQRISYDYDAPTHGFNLYVDADGATEVRVQRINGAFTANGWLSATSGTFRDSYNYTRFYPPAGPGIGGVEPGQYLISARRVGQPTTEKSATVTLTHGFRTIFPVPTNQAPVVSRFIASQTTQPNTPFTFTIPANTFADPDGDALAYTISGQPTGITIDRNTLVGTPTQNGTFVITVRANDGKGGVVFTEFTLVVTSPSTPPTSTTTTPPSTTTATPPSATTTTPGNTNPAVAGLQKVGYKYDAPTNGFQLLVKADAPVEVKLERLDGAFSPSDWGATVAFTQEDGYNTQRFYAPIRPGVGGVVAGKYRLSARLIGKPETVVTSDVVLQYGVFPIFAAPATTNPSVTSPPSTTTTPPSTTTTTTPPSAQLSIRTLGYKYDAPTHGFEVLVDANSPVQIRLERVDGPFGPTDWQMGTAQTEFTGYNYRRFYPPILPGVGGVVAGTYRIKARIADQPGTEVSVEVVLQYGVFQAYPPQKVLNSPELSEPLVNFPIVPDNCGGCIPMQGERIR